MATGNREGGCDGDPAGALGCRRQTAAVQTRKQGQFEYFYLLITTDGQMYLIAEYAYG